MVGDSSQRKTIDKQMNNICVHIYYCTVIERFKKTWLSAALYILFIPNDVRCRDMWMELGTQKYGLNEKFVQHATYNLKGFIYVGSLGTRGRSLGQHFMTNMCKKFLYSHMECTRWRKLKGGSESVRLLSGIPPTEEELEDNEEGFRKWRARAVKTDLADLDVNEVGIRELSYLWWCTGAKDIRINCSIIPHNGRSYGKAETKLLHKMNEFCWKTNGEYILLNKRLMF